MKNLLLFPPAWIPTQPYLSLPSLTAYLREKKITVVQKDLNLEFYYWLSKADIISELYEKLKNKSVTDKEEYEILQMLKDVLITNSEYWIKNLRSKEKFFSEKPYEYGLSLDIPKYLLKLISLVYSPQEITFGNYDQGKKINNAKELFKVVDFYQNNLFYDFYSEILYNEQLFSDINLVGISIIGQEQLVPGLILAKMVKEKFNHISVCVGGPIITRLKDALIKNKEFFKIIDYAILFEGEYPLYSLCKALESKSKLDIVPNLIYYSDDEVHYTFTQSGLNIDEIPTPDFEGLPLEKYFSPEISLPLLTSRGCYWNQCAFCDHSYIYNSNFRFRKIEDILQDIRVLNEKYSVKFFSFVDECIPPKIFKNLSDQLDILPFTIFWSCDLRFEHSFMDEELFTKAYKSGLRVIFFGLESGCQRVLNLMNKGTKIEDIQKILSLSAKTGIWNHLFGIFGFPTETQKEFEITKRFLEKNADFFHSVGLARFSLNRFSSISLNPKLYNISRLKLHGDIRLDLDYECNSGICKEEIDQIDQYNEKHGYSVTSYYDDFLRLFHRDLWYIYLSKYSTSEIKGFSSDSQKTDRLLKTDELIKLKDFVFFKSSIDGDKLLLFDLKLGNYLEFTIETQRIIEELTHPVSIENLSVKLANEFGISLNDARDELVGFINELYYCDLISIV
ncbi:MAG: radical SAM protein [Halanaerobiales bacterium]|nr:radical SAM protein [Halanaerobiales bacterium]